MGISGADTVLTVEGNIDCRATGKRQSVQRGQRAERVDREGHTGTWEILLIPLASCWRGRRITNGPGRAHGTDAYRSERQVHPKVVVWRGND